MPTIFVIKDLLFESLGIKKESDEEEYKFFQDLCFNFGLELDGKTNTDALVGRQKELNIDSPKTVYKIDIPANRYDLLCLEGLSRALRIFLNKDIIPKFSEKLINFDTSGKDYMVIKSSVKSFRPYVLCTILRDIQFNDSSYNSFLDLQDKLHFNICRKRSLCAIGTHDYDKIKGPFTYEAKDPQDIEFKALEQEEEMSADKLLKYYNESDSHLKNYLPIISSFDKYPVIYDDTGHVLSLPPIINSEYSKMSVETKNIFIEVTCTDFNKGSIVMNTLIANFSAYCKNFDKHCIQSIKTEYRNDDNSVNNIIYTPELEEKKISVDVDYIGTSIGLTPQLEAEKIIEYLKRMELESSLIETNESKSKTLEVRIPITRNDILHPCDVLEDCAIAYGYNKISAITPSTCSIGKQIPLSKLSDLNRNEIANAGFDEVLTWTLSSYKDNYDAINHSFDNLVVKIENPVSSECEVCRTQLISSLLKTVASNQAVTLPIKLFEIGDVVHLDDSTDTGSINKKYLGAIYSNINSAGFEIIHGLLDRVMLKNSFIGDMKEKKKGRIYYEKKSNDEAFMKECRFDIYVSNSRVKDKCIGVMGWIDPEIELNELR